MKSVEFVYWLQGYFEIEEARAGEKAPILGAEQVECIKKHLALVFKHEIDPSYGSKAHQDALNKIHDAKPPRPPAGTGGEPGDKVYRC